MTGPLFERNMPPLPQADETHLVSSGFWKIIAIQRGDTLATASFVFPQETTRRADICGHLVSIDEIESRTWLDFFSALETSIEDPLEAGGFDLAPSFGC